MSIDSDITAAYTGRTEARAIARRVFGGVGAWIAEAVDEPEELTDLLEFMEHRETATTGELYEAMGGRGLDLVAGLMGIGFARWTEEGFRLCRSAKDWDDIF